jgi:hypothetical protein
MSSKKPKVNIPIQVLNKTSNPQVVKPREVLIGASKELRCFFKRISKHDPFNYDKFPNLQ